MDDLSASALKQVHEDRKKCQRDTYKRIYLQVCDKIRKVNKQFYVKSCKYFIPVLIWGYPLYKLHECLIYIRWRLKKKGIQTNFTYPNALYISWEKVVDTRTTIETIAEDDEERSKDNEYVEEIRWDRRLIDEKNEKTLEEQKRREEYRREHHRRSRLKREEHYQEENQRHRQEEIEEIIKRKNKQALIALEYGLDDVKPKRKVLQITSN
jgi:hypothetical protein